MAEGKQAYLVINPHSGYGGQREMLSQLRAEVRREGVSLVEYVTTSPGDATRYTREVAPGASAVIAFGGDGTVNEVATGLAGSGVPLVLAPAGTENLLAKELHCSRKPDEIIQTLLHGRRVCCDMGRINDQSFHSILGVGFDAEVVRRLSAIRTGHISHLSYFWPMWRTFWEHDFPILRIDADGEEVFSGPGMAFVGNISRYATGLRICRDARFDDGLLDLVVFECQRQDRLILHAAWTLLRLHPLKGDVIYRPARQIRIESRDPMRCQIDGDVGPAAPLDISVSPDKMQILLPPSAARRSWRWRNGARA